MKLVEAMNDIFDGKIEAATDGKETLVMPKPSIWLSIDGNGKAMVWADKGEVALREDWADEWTACEYPDAAMSVDVGQLLREREERLRADGKGN
jgi:hypothetical protein